MKRLSINLLIIVLLGGLTGCKSLYSNYSRPADIQTSGLMREATESTDSSVCTLSWRQVFRDPLLAQIIDSALSGNSDLQTARLRTEEAKATLQASKKAFLPSLSFAPQGQVSSFGGDKAAKTYSLDLSAQWEADAFGSLRNQKKESEMSLAEYRAYNQAVQTQLIATVAESYYTLEMLDKELQITQETVDTW